MADTDFGFIMTRHVTSATTNQYWNHSVKLLRSLYPRKKIVIIDDASDPTFRTIDQLESEVEVVTSEFPGAGELLPYYYYIRRGAAWFDNAVILHDSVFLHKRIRFEALSQTKVMPLWHFNADRENLATTLRLADASLHARLSLKDAVLGLQHTKWWGCFGSQAYINREFLLSVDRKYGLTAMTSAVRTREHRCCLERILGCIFYTEYPKICSAGIRSIFGDIMHYQAWCGYSFEQYMKDLQSGLIIRPAVKIWTGR